MVNLLHVCRAVVNEKTVFVVENRSQTCIHRVNLNTSYTFCFVGESLYNIVFMLLEDTFL